jgi:uncharacterized membrane protein
VQIPDPGALEPRPRSSAIDILRGLAIALMGLDHALAALDPGHFVSDSAALWQPGSELPAGRFLLRAASHVCAPIFVLLAGASLALARARHGALHGRRGAERALFLMLLDPLALSFVWARIEPLPRPLLFQVIFAIGASMAIGLAALRWVPRSARTSLALLYLLAQDAVVFAALGGRTDVAPSGVVAFALTGGLGESWLVVYPVLPWCAVLCLGLPIGEALAAGPETARALPRRLAILGLLALALFALVRGANGYGNLGLARDDLAPLQWLHCSKYPPSLSYLALTLGTALLLLAGLLRAERTGASAARALGVLALLGRAALPCYLAHLLLLAALRAALPESWRGTPLALLVALALPCALAPLARTFLAARTARPAGWLRLL